jgi:hypothetical protein
MQNNLACKKRCLTNIGYRFITPFIVVVQLNRTLARENQKSPLVLKKLSINTTNQMDTMVTPLPLEKKKKPQKIPKK